MRYLLDTQTLLWWITKPNVLSPSMRDFLDDRSNELFLSVVIPWELAIKTRTGKLDAHQILREIEFGQLMQDLQVLYADISHVIRAGLLPLHHRDPFDRLLAAQALDLGIPIVSRDMIFDRYGVQRIWH
ncbi:MAG: type II toxin-antitoxin system VapC family toxin [Terracidiphilus sp.]|jgi:PIN domain nuclease of toxin-antitoxin system